MKKYVFTIKDDVCAANDKDIEATDLLAKMKLWGDVEDYEKVIAPVKEEYQRMVDNITAQLNAIKAQELTDDEIVLLNAYRGCKGATSEAFLHRISALEEQLAKDRADYQKKAEQISELLAQ